MATRIGSITTTAMTVTKQFDSPLVERAIAGGEMAYTRMRGSTRNYVLRYQWTSGASDVTNIQTLDQYVNAQVPVWMDHADKYGELQAFGYLTRMTTEYQFESMREFEYIFTEIPAWGRLYVNRVDGYQLHACDGSDGWVATKSGGTSVTVGVMTSGMKEGKGALSNTCVAVTGWALLTYTLPTPLDLRQYHGFTLWFNTTSLTNLTDVKIGFGDDTGNIYTYTCTTLPNRTGAWVQIGFQRDDMTTTGSPDWSHIDKIFLYADLGGAFTGTLYFDDIRVVGVGEDFLIRDEGYTGSPGIGDQNSGVVDILSPIWGRYDWALDRTNKYWTETFGLTNLCLKVLPTTVNDCEATTDWTASGTADTPAIAVQAGTIGNPVVKEGTYCMKVSAADQTNTETLYGQYNPTTTLDLSKQDFAGFWFWPNQIVNLAFKVRITDTAGDYYEYNFSPLDAYLWNRILIPLRDPDVTSATPDLSIINHIQFYQTASDTITTPKFLVDDIVGDFGGWGILEVQCPDRMDGDSDSEYYSWTGAAFEKFAAVNHGGWPGTMSTDATATKLETLDGRLSETVYGADKHFIIGPALIPGDANVVPTGACNSVIRCLISHKLGCKRRILVGFKLAPSTELASYSGDLGLNKILLKFIEYYQNELTTILD